MKMSKSMKRIVAGVTGLAVAAGIFIGHSISDVQDVQADTKVFTEITEKFAADKPITILEISTAQDKDNYDVQYAVGGQNVNQRINQNAELGYFMPYNAPAPIVAGYNAKDGANTPAYMGLASQGGKYGDPMTGMDGHGTEDDYLKMLLDYSKFGLVKPQGKDNGWNTYVGEYPMYSYGATFSKADDTTKNYLMAGDELVKGTYTPAPGGGAYRFKSDEYVLHNGVICTEEKIVVPGVSDNDTVTGTDFDTDPDPDPEKFADETVAAVETVEGTILGDSIADIVDDDNNGDETFLDDAVIDIDFADGENLDDADSSEDIEKKDDAGNPEDNEKKDDTESPEDGEKKDAAENPEEDNKVDADKAGEDDKDKDKEDVPTPEVEYEYKPVDIAPGKQLPHTLTGEPIIEAVDDGKSGDLNFTPNEAAIPPYYGYSGEPLWYSPSGADSSRSKNSGWFAEYVLGSYKTFADVNLKYDVKYAGNVTAADVADYDLIYISGTAAEFEGNDLSLEAVKALYESTINENKAIIMDYLGYDKDSNTNYAVLAALLWQESQNDLLSEDSSILKMTDGASVTLDIELLTANDDALGALKGRMLTENDNFIVKTQGNFVVGNVYVYDHRVEAFDKDEVKAKENARDSFATGDFITPYNDVVVDAGFNNVMQYIDAANRNSLTGNITNVVTPAVVIQYILVSDGIPLTVMKTALDVLEIQSGPTYLYNPGRGSEEYEDLTGGLEKFRKNRDKFIADYLTDYYDRDEMRKYVSFTSMTVTEFNGINDDLTENFDIIYIGAEMVKQYGKTEGKMFFNTYDDVIANRQSAEKDTYAWNDTIQAYGEEGGGTKKMLLPNYYDDNMDGMIYYNIGDLHNFSDNNNPSRFRGFLKQEIPANGKSALTRFPGRDFTKDKLAKMKNFLNAGALVIVAEDLYGSPNGANVEVPEINPTFVQNQDNGRVDNSSNLYEFLKFGQGYVWDEASGKYVNRTENEEARVYPNMVSAADIKRGIVDKASLNQYISAFKLELLLSERPAEYGYGTFTTGGNVNHGAQATGLTNVIDPDTVVYLNTKNENGTRILKYVFTISDDPTFLADEEEQGFGSQYYCRLYIDINNDGKYSKTTEDISDIRIVDAAGNEAMRNPDVDDDHYLLQPGVEYTLTREIADDYCGILKWKLNVESRYSSTIHASEEGYTMVKNETGQKKVIKILQITKEVLGGTQGSNLNLMRALYEERTQVRNGNQITHDNWGRYLYDLPDYELEVRTLSIKEFEKDFMDKYRDQNPQGLSAEDYAMEVYFPKFEIKSQNVTKDFYGTQYNFANEETVTGVNMLVLGFADNMTAFEENESVSAIRAFIAAGKPVLLAHDFLHFTEARKQTRILREVAGMDKYGVSQMLVPKTDVVQGASNDVKRALFTNRWSQNGVDYSTANDPAAANYKDYLHTGTAFTRTGNPDAFALIEGTDKEVAYAPGSNRGTTVRETQGFSFDLINRYSLGENLNGNRQYNNINIQQGKNDFFNKEAAPGAYSPVEGGWWKGSNEIQKINDGQITQYPYILPDSFVVSQTHGQYYELDLSSDSDDDGESDVVVWYAMGPYIDDANGQRVSYDRAVNNQKKSYYDDEIGLSIDPASGYYIYNKGNLTYTGAGDADMEGSPETQIQLFVNVLLAAYQSGNVNPEGDFYDKADINATPISSFIVPYDSNVTKPENGAGGVDSGVTKKKGSEEYAYKFVDPNNEKANVDRVKDGTVVYFRIDDKNFVRGTKKISVGYYLQVNETPGTNVKIQDTELDRTVRALDVDENRSVNVIDLSDYIRTYKVTNNVIANAPMAVEDKNDGTSKRVRDVDSGLIYAIYLPMNYLNDKASFTIYLEAQTTVTSVTTMGVETQEKTGEIYIPLTVVKADLLDLD